MQDNRYYRNAKHRAWRERVLRRDRYLCQECLRYGRKTPATIAHHKLPREVYPELQYYVANGVALCMACHNRKHPEKGQRPPLPARVTGRGRELAGVKVFPSPAREKKFPGGD